MAMRKYLWNGFKYKIADEDLQNYPGAILIEDARPEAARPKVSRPTEAEISAQKPEKKAKAEPKNKARTAKNKATQKKEQ